ASLLDRARLADEELVIVVGAALAQFLPLAELQARTLELAEGVGIHVDRDVVVEVLTRPRRDVFAAVDERVANFARCGIDRLDEWANACRLERRMALPRAAVLLSVPQEQWREPPRQQYVADLLEHFEKRVSASVGRGPLVRFVVGKTTPRVDVTELGSVGTP